MRRGNLNYIEPAMPPELMVTYSASAPLKTHTRRATCQEIGCGQYQNGWKLRVEALTPQLLHDATHSGRRWRRVEEAPGISWLVFEAGQVCFAADAHRIKLDRAPLYVVRGGDFRGNPRGTRRVHANADDFVEDYQENRQKLPF